MTFHVQTSKESEDLKSIVCNLALSPIEAVIRQRSLANLTQFASDFAENKRNASTQPRSAPDQVSEKFQISFSCQLPSLTVEIPLTKSIPVAPLFNRCGETLRNAAAREASLGLTLWTIDFQWTTGDQINSERNLESSAAFNFCHMLIFATAPVGDKVSPGAKMQRIDFMLLNGRTEVDPYIPISFQYKKKLPLSSDGSLGREFFPVVPTLSSFKARQEDEDDELKIDRLLFSKLRNVEADSRKDLRGTDPQIAMVTDAEKSDIVISISIPEMFLDLTKAELTTIITMLESANPAEAFGSSHAKGENADTISLSKPTCLGIAFNIEQMTFSLKQNFCIQDLYGDKTRKDRFSCLLAVNNLRVHVLLNGSNLRHFRLMMHDLGFYSGQSAFMLILGLQFTL